MSDVDLVVDGHQILNGVSWVVNPGEHWALLGPNGGGKTTLLKMAGFRVHPTRGSVRVLGVGLGGCDLRTERARIGFVSQAMADAFRRTIPASDVVMGARNDALETWWHDYSEADREEALHWCAEMGVDHVAHRPFGGLSSGERVRTLIARTLMAGAELLLLDEPAAGLDLPGREDLLQRIDQLTRRPDGPTLVLVTHHVEEIPTGLSHIGFVTGGKLVNTGPLRDTLTSHALTEVMGRPVELLRSWGRYWAFAPPSDAAGSPG